MEPTAAIDCLSTPQAPQPTETSEKSIQDTEHSSGTPTPVSTYTGMQLTSKTDTRTEQSHKSTTKRSLFQEEDTDNKKKEKMKHKTTQVPNNIHASHQLLRTKVLIFLAIRQCNACLQA